MAVDFAAGHQRVLARKGVVALEPQPSDGGIADRDVGQEGVEPQLSGEERHRPPPEAVPLDVEPVAAERHAHERAQLAIVVRAAERVRGREGLLESHARRGARRLTRERGTDIRRVARVGEPAVLQVRESGGEEGGDVLGQAVLDGAAGVLEPDDARVDPGDVAALEASFGADRQTLAEAAAVSTPEAVDGPPGQKVVEAVELRPGVLVLEAHVGVLADAELEAGAEPVRARADARERDAVQLGEIRGRHLREFVAGEERHARRHHVPQRRVGTLIEAVQLVDVLVAAHVSAIAGRELGAGRVHRQHAERDDDEDVVPFGAAGFSRPPGQRHVRIPHRRDAHTRREAPSGQHPVVELRRPVLRRTGAAADQHEGRRGRDPTQAFRVHGSSSSPSHGLGNDDRVAGLQVDRLDVAVDRILVVEAQRRDAGRRLALDADVLGLREILEAAGRRERLQHGHLADERHRAGRVDLADDVDERRHRLLDDDRHHGIGDVLLQ